MSESGCANVCTRLSASVAGSILIVEIQEIGEEFLSPICGPFTNDKATGPTEKWSIVGLNFKYIIKHDAILTLICTKY